MVERNDAPVRQRHIDILKGIGISLVILGHMIPRGLLWNLIYGVHMPLFLFCSGLFEKSKLQWPRLLKLAIYYFAMAIIGVGVDIFLFHPGDLIYVKQALFDILIGGPSPKHTILPVAALWFLPSLALITLCYHLLRKIPSVWAQYLIIIAAVFIGAILTGYRDTVIMYYNFDISLLLFPFFYIGASLKPDVSQMAKIHSGKLLIIAVVAGVAYFILSWLNGEINIYRGVWGRFLPVYYVEALIGTTTLLAFSILLMRCTQPVSAVLALLGKHTLIMMGTHQLFLLLLRPLFSTQILLFFATVLISWGVSYGFSVLTKKSYKKTNY